MNREEIISVVNEFLTEELEIDAALLNDDARLKEDLKIDSLDFVDIAVIVEKQFKIKIKPEEMKTVKTSRPHPNAAQLSRIRNGIERWGIVHWGLNTYTDREWGYGDEDPKMFDPNCREDVLLQRTAQ